MHEPSKSVTKVGSCGLPEVVGDKIQPWHSGMVTPCSLCPQPQNVPRSPPTAEAAALITHLCTGGAPGGAGVPLQQTWAGPGSYAPNKSVVISKGQPQHAPTCQTCLPMSRGPSNAAPGRRIALGMLCLWVHAYGHCTIKAPIPCCQSVTINNVNKLFDQKANNSGQPSCHRYCWDQTPPSTLDNLQCSHHTHHTCYASGVRQHV